MQFGCTIPLIKWFYDNEKLILKKQDGFLIVKIGLDSKLQIIFLMILLK